MNECEKILQFAQHELPPQEEAFMRAHLQTCVACQKQLAFLDKVDQALQPVSAPEGLVDRVFAQTTRRKVRFFSWQKLITATAMALVLGVIGLNLKPTSSSVFDEDALVAYMQVNLEEQYQWLDEDLTAMEEDF